MRKIIFTGGGTYGHISPIIAILDVLKKNARVKYLYIGSRNGPEKEIAKNDDLNFKGIFVGKRRNYISFSNFIDLFKILFGIIQSYFILKKFKPDIIFSKGGYAAFPIVFWAKHFKIDLIIHESDSIIGGVNYYASKFAKYICVGFPVEYYKGQNIPFERLTYTGTPLRREFYEAKEEPHEPAIIITGGSQGAQKINNIILEIAPALVEKYQVYHICGKRDYEKNRKAFANGKYHLIDVTDKMAQLMINSDLVIARSGSTVAEISILGKPSILIPLPSSHLNHQAQNAKIYREKNAAVVISEKNLTGSSLLSIINHLMEDKVFRDLLGHRAQELSRVDATTDIIDLIFGSANGNSNGN